ncbi:MAG: hypothetical protein ACKOOL_07575 [Novosphingobium sp.]
MKYRVGAGLIASVILALSPIEAGKPKVTAPDILPADFLAVPQTRAVNVILAQTQVTAGYVPSELKGISNYGGLGGFIAEDMQNSSRAKKADKLSMAINAETGDLDVAALAQKSAGDAISQVPWLSAAPVTFSRDGSAAAKSSFLDSAATDQAVFIEYAYDLSADFGTLRLIETISVARRVTALAKAKPIDRLRPENMVYSQSIVVSVQIPGTLYHTKDDNAALWSAKKGDRLRRALSQAFATASRLTPRTLEITYRSAYDLAANTHPGYALDGETARVIEQTGYDRVLWLRRFVAVEYLH